MDKNEIIKILEDWNFWKKKLDTGIKRASYIDRLKKFLNTNQILVIMGARRSGKSFIMKQLAQCLINENNVNPKDVLIINFEDPRFVELDARTLQKIYEIYLEFIHPKKMPYIFLDEIQEVKEWEKWVRTMHELNKAKIIISGSNAKFLSYELATLLTGRHIDLTISPLSFREYLIFNNIDVKDKLDVINKEVIIKGLLKEYLEYGSFPWVVLSREKKEILLNYFDDVLTKDLIKRFKIRKVEKLKSLAKFYLSNISTLTTFSSMGKFLKISTDTIEKFSNYFENVYLFFFLKRFSFKIKEQDKSPRKLYAIDTGLSNTVGFKFSENAGHIAENTVFLELRRRQAVSPNLEIYYWKDQHHREVDFVIKQNMNVKSIIQVCWNLNLEKVRNRETRILFKAMNEFNLKKSLVITEDYEAKEDIKGKQISYIPLWKWLLNIL